MYYRYKYSLSRFFCFFFFKQKTAYEMRIRDWSSDVCSSDLSYELVSGQRLWEINIAGISTPSVVGEWVFAVTSDAKLLCVARATGKIRWISQLRRWEKEKKKDKAIRRSDEHTSALQSLLRISYAVFCLTK